MKPEKPDVEFFVPMTPPSGNHYVKHTRSGRHYVTQEAKHFKNAVLLCSRGARTRRRWYFIRVSIGLGRKERGDLDNFAKVTLDALVEAGIIDSDAKVSRLTMDKKRNWERPGTSISIWQGEACN